MKKKPYWRIVSCRIFPGSSSCSCNPANIHDESTNLKYFMSEMRTWLHCRFALKHGHVVEQVLVLVHRQRALGCNINVLLLVIYIADANAAR
jgi:hypothetical protein